MLAFNKTYKSRVCVTVNDYLGSEIFCMWHIFEENRKIFEFGWLKIVPFVVWQYIEYVKWKKILNLEELIFIFLKEILALVDFILCFL